jgi:hypothetical protein
MRNAAAASGTLGDDGLPEIRKVCVRSTFKRPTVVVCNLDTLDLDRRAS